MPEAPSIKGGIQNCSSAKNDPEGNQKQKLQSQDPGNQHSEDYLKYGPHRGNNQTSSNQQFATSTVQNTDKNFLSGSDSDKPITVDRSTANPIGQNNKGSMSSTPDGGVFNFAFAAISICAVVFLILIALGKNESYLIPRTDAHPSHPTLTDSRPGDPSGPLNATGQHSDSFSNTTAIVTPTFSVPLSPAPPEPLKPVPALTPTQKVTPPKKSSSQAKKNEPKKLSIHDWIKLAEQGDVQAQSQLGHMYAIGEGTPKNYDEAVRWNFIAAKSGSARAQSNLGVAYGNGQGVPSDAIEAYAWWYLAANNGSAAARSNMKKFDKVLTAKQKSQAIERSKALAR